MQAKEGVVNRLNTILTQQLTAINQYFIHAKMCGNWGYGRLYHWLREASIKEMKDAEAVIEHILYLEGVPNLQRLGTVSVGETVPEHFRLDLQTEQAMILAYNDAITHCLQVQDYTTHHILEEMLKEAEERIDWLETQLTLIEQIGLVNYLSQQLHD